LSRMPRAHARLAGLSRCVHGAPVELHLEKLWDRNVTLNVQK